MDPSREKELDFLLARGRLARPARERVLDAVVSANSRGGALHRHARKAVWLAPLAAAALVVLLARPTDFRSKGSAAVGLTLELTCGDSVGTALRCARNDLLYFRLIGKSDRSFFVAYAEPSDGGERVWFFPTAATPTAEIRAGTEPRVASSAVMLADVPPGRYVVHAWISPKPLERTNVGSGQSLRATTLEVLP